MYRLRDKSGLGGRSWGREAGLQNLFRDLAFWALFPECLIPSPVVSRFPNPVSRAKLLSLAMFHKNKGVSGEKPRPSKNLSSCK
jgi:hypothetical protein